MMIIVAACSIMAIYKKTFLFAVIFIPLSLGNGQSTAILKDTESSIGATVTLYCNSSNGNIEWHHLHVDRTVPEIVYQDGFIFNGYKERYSVNRKDSGDSNLVIKNVKTTDAGKYTCVEKSKITDQKSAELIVFEQFPSIKYCAAKFTCTPVCDVLELTCSMKAHGNIVPSMEWRESDKGIMTSNANTENGITVSSLQVDLQRGTSYNQSYVCRVKYPTYASMTSQFSWSYLVSAPLAPASQPSSQSDEKLQAQPNINGFIVIIALMTATIVALIVAILILFFRNKRKTTELNSRIATGNDEIARYKKVEDGSASETKDLLTTEDEDDNSNYIVPRTKLNKNKSIFGIGILDKELFLLTRGGSVIEVFDLENSKFKRAWIIKKLINPNDMATCPIMKFIFICDWKIAGKRSEIICCDQNGNIVGGWTCGFERGRISVTKETNVIVAENFGNTINEYKQAGRNVDQFRTEKAHLEHAVKLENGNFVAGFGDVNDKLKEICIFDPTGKIFLSINQDSFLQNGAQLSVPRSFAVDKEGTIYVCDVHKRRVILLSPELEYKGKIDQGENEERLRGPLRLCIHESQNKRQLLVADSVKNDGEWIDGRILALNPILP